MVPTTIIGMQISRENTLASLLMSNPEFLGPSKGPSEHGLLHLGSQTYKNNLSVTEVVMVIKSCLMLFLISFLHSLFFFSPAIRHAS